MNMSYLVIFVQLFIILSMQNYGIAKDQPVRRSYPTRPNLQEPLHKKQTDSHGRPAAPSSNAFLNQIGKTLDFSNNNIRSSTTNEQVEVSEDFSDATWPLSDPEKPEILNIQVQCEKSHIRVNIEFDRAFFGTIFSKGYFSDQRCIHMRSGSGTMKASFEILLNTCGMSTSGNTETYGQPNPMGSFVENTIVIQYDPQVQEVWDQARKLRCTWYDYYEKSVTFRPFQVNMLNAVTANFLGDNLQCWMQIQTGKGPWSNEVSGIVKIGQTMTMVLGIKDDENKFDMLVRNCVAHDGERTPIQLVDDQGCVTRSKIMSNFQKMKNFGPSATVASYAFFQAFKFPDSINVHFQCVIQVCRFSCPQPNCLQPQVKKVVSENNIHQSTTNAPPYSASNRKRKSGLGQLPPFLLRNKVGIPFPGKQPALHKHMSQRIKRDIDKHQIKEKSSSEVNTRTSMQVVSPNDVSFLLTNDMPATSRTGLTSWSSSEICLSLPSFAIYLIILLIIVVVSVVSGSVMCMQLKVKSKNPTPATTGHLKTYTTKPKIIRNHLDQLDWRVQR